MISRIRVEARAASMEQAEREIATVLGHAQMAGYLEGLVPQSSRLSDEHYGHSPTTALDPWTELGLGYEGRQAVTFDPEVVQGGLKEYGYQVKIESHDDAPDDPPRPPHHLGEPGEDVTDKVIVLERNVPVTRDSIFETASEATADLTPENMKRVTALATHKYVNEFGFHRRGPLWLVDIAWSKPVSGQSNFVAMSVGQSTTFEGATLSEALDKAEEMLRAVTSEPGSNDSSMVA